MFLTVLVAMIMVRALRKDIQRYNAEVGTKRSEVVVAVTVTTRLSFACRLSQYGPPL